MLSIVSQLNLVKCQKWDENVTFLKKDPKYFTFTTNIAKIQWKVLAEKIRMYPVNFLYWIFNIATRFSKEKRNKLDDLVHYSVWKISD